MVKVNIEGFGTYEIEILKVNELLRWLSSHKAVNIQEKNTIKEVQNNGFTGRVLLTD
jgi:hypothetical protein